MKYQVIKMQFEEPLSDAQENMLIGEFQHLQGLLAQECDKLLKGFESAGNDYGKVEEQVRKMPIIGGFAGGMNQALLNTLIAKINNLKGNSQKYMILTKDSNLTYFFWMPDATSELVNTKVGNHVISLKVFSAIDVMKALRKDVFPRMQVKNFFMVVEQKEHDPEKEG